MMVLRSFIFNTLCCGLHFRAAVVYTRNPDLFHRVGRHAFLFGVNTIALYLLQSRVAGNRLNLFCRASRFGQSAAHAFAESMCAQTKRETRFATGTPEPIGKSTGRERLAGCCRQEGQLPGLGSVNDRFERRVNRDTHIRAGLVLTH